MERRERSPFQSMILTPSTTIVTPLLRTEQVIMLGISSFKRTFLKFASVSHQLFPSNVRKVPLPFGHPSTTNIICLSPLHRVHPRYPGLPFRSATTEISYSSGTE